MSKLMTLILRPRYSHKNQIKIDYEAHFLTDLMWNNKIKKNQLNKRYKKQLESIRVNLLSIILMSWDQNNLMKSKQNKLWNLILNQINIKGWHWKKKTESTGLTR